MKYIGSKRRIFNKFQNIILSNKSESQYYIEPFVGGCNSIQNVSGQRIGSDNNKYLIAFWNEIQNGYELPYITYDQYIDIRDNKDNYPDYLVGHAGFNASYNGKWFGGYAKFPSRDYMAEAIRHINKQRQYLNNITFINCEYSKLYIPKNSIIYCDPPYFGTYNYARDFNHDLFWEWCRKQTKYNTIFISEYIAPNDFVSIWTSNIKSSLSLNKFNKTEHLFVHESQI